MVLDSMTFTLVRLPVVGGHDLKHRPEGLMHTYQPQGKVMFSEASVCPQGGLPTSAYWGGVVCLLLPT